MISRMLIQMLPQQLIYKIGANDAPGLEIAQAIRSQSLQWLVLLEPYTER